MFDVGGFEMLLIFIIVLVVVGPDRLPGIVRIAGKWIGQARRTVNQFKREFEDEFEVAELRKELRESARIEELQSLKKDMGNIERDLDSEFKKADAEFDLLKKSGQSTANQSNKSSSSDSTSKANSKVGSNEPTESNQQKELGPEQTGPTDPTADKPASGAAQTDNSDTAANQATSDASQPKAKLTPTEINNATIARNYQSKSASASQSAAGASIAAGAASSGETLADSSDKDHSVRENATENTIHSPEMTSSSPKQYSGDELSQMAERASRGTPAADLADHRQQQPAESDASSSSSVSADAAQTAAAKDPSNAAAPQPSATPKDSDKNHT